MSLAIPRRLLHSSGEAQATGGDEEGTALGHAARRSRHAIDAPLLGEDDDRTIGQKITRSQNASGAEKRGVEWRGREGKRSTRISFGFVHTRIIASRERE